MANAGKTPIVLYFPEISNNLADAKILFVDGTDIVHNYRKIMQKNQRDGVDMYDVDFDSIVYFRPVIAPHDADEETLKAAIEAAKADTKRYCYTSDCGFGECPLRFAVTGSPLKRVAFTVSKSHVTLDPTRRGRSARNVRQCLQDSVGTVTITTEALRELLDDAGTGYVEDYKKWHGIPVNPDARESSAHDPLDGENSTAVQFKLRAAEYYGLKYDAGTKMLQDMLGGMNALSDTILTPTVPASLEKHNAFQIPLGLPDKSHDDPRSYLLLPADVELAFSAGLLMVVPSKSDIPRIRVLQPGKVSRKVQRLHGRKLYLPKVWEGRIPFLSELGWMAWMALVSRNTHRSRALTTI